MSQWNNQQTGRYVNLIIDELSSGRFIENPKIFNV